MLKPYLGPRERPLPPGNYSACPFCAGRRLKMAIHNVEGEPIQEMIWCTSCDALGPRWSPEKKFAVAAWNERQPLGEKKLYPGENLVADLLALSPKDIEDGERRVDLLAILGCPFCGSNEAFFAQMAGSPKWVVGCGICKGQGPLGSDQRDSSKRWNKREKPLELDPEELSNLRRSLLESVSRDSEQEITWEAVGHLDALATIFADAKDYEGLCDMAMGTGRFDQPSIKEHLSPLAQKLLTKLLKDGKTQDQISELCRGAKQLADQAVRDYEEVQGEAPEVE